MMPNLAATAAMNGHAEPESLFQHPRLKVIDYFIPLCRLKPAASV